MKKLMAIVSMLALMLVMAVPAFAATAYGGDIDYVDCDQVQLAATAQYNYDNDQRLAGVAQDLSVDQNQVSACSGSIAAGSDFNYDNGYGYDWGWYY